MEIAKESIKEVKNRFVEGLGVRVDLPERTMYLDVNKNEATSEWLPSIYFADWLDTGESQIKKIICDLKIEGRFDESLGEIIYPPLTFEIVSQEHSWNQKYRALNNKLTPAEIGAILNRDYRYITKKALSLGYRPQKGKFSKAALAEIRENDLSTPFDEGWYTLMALATETGRDRGWIQNRLNELGIISEKRRSLENGITLNYYPPETLDSIKKCVKETPKYGDDWYTSCRIVQDTGRSRAWVNNRLKDCSDDSEDRLDDMGVRRLHYPRYVFENILIEAEQSIAKSQSEGWLTAKEVADVLGINESSVYRKFDEIRFTTEVRKTSTGKSVKHYSPKDVAKIIREEKLYINESALVRKIGKSVYWICTRLEKLGIQSKRSHYGMTPGKLYHKKVIKILENEIKQNQSL